MNATTILKSTKSVFNLLGLFVKNYFNFKGIINRKDFWLTMLYLAISTIIIYVALIGLGIGLKGFMEGGDAAAIVIIILMAYLFFLIIPLISMTARRINDTGRNSLFVLLPWGLIIIGVVIRICNMDDGNSWYPEREQTYRIWGTILLLIGFLLCVALCCTRTKAQSINNEPNSNTRIDVTEQLMKLKSLLDQGILTQEEFDMQKQQILKNT